MRASKAAASYGVRVLRFTSKNGFHEALGRLGHIPLPPYIKRADEPADRERYQTGVRETGNCGGCADGGAAFHV